jgi:hypothetical protein
MHMLLATARDGEGILGIKSMLLDLQDDMPGGNHDAPAPEQQALVETMLQEYRQLHKRILDPEDSSVEKRFLILRSSHGISNTQIEEVTALLMAIETRRALILDFSNDSYTGPRPALEYDWPIDVWVDGLLPFLEVCSLLKMRGPVSTSAQPSHPRPANLCACPLACNFNLVLVEIIFLTLLSSSQRVRRMRTKIWRMAEPRKFLGTG